jgi:hypothetical protein
MSVSAVPFRLLGAGGDVDADSGSDNDGAGAIIGVGPIGGRVESGCSLFLTRGGYQ